MGKSDELEENVSWYKAQGLKKEIQDSFLYENFTDNFKRIESIKNEPLKLAIMGEYNAGKSTFINRLIGLNLPTGRTPTTKIITKIRYGEKEKLKIIYRDSNSDTGSYSEKEYDGFEKLNEFANKPKDLLEYKEIILYVNNDILKSFEIIDTPGLNDATEYDKETKEVFDKVNFVIWIFNANQPFSESEKKSLQAFTEKSHYKNNIYAFINHADLREEGDLKQMIQELSEQEKYFMNQKNILAVSSKKDDEKWNNKFEKLEMDLKSYILNQDTKHSIIQIKLEIDDIRNNLEEIKVKFQAQKHNVIKTFETFIGKFMQNEEAIDTKEKVLEDLKKNIKDISKEIDNDNLSSNNYISTSLKFLCYYKTTQKLDTIDEDIKMLYTEYIDIFLNEIQKIKIAIQDSYKNLITLDKKFQDKVFEKCFKLEFTLEALKDVKQLLIVGYIIGILTDNFIYKNFRKDSFYDITKALNFEVIESLIDMDLDIQYFMDKIVDIKEMYNSFFEDNINRIDKSLIRLGE